jgi:pilus assembly protein Flp/PilA
MSKFYSFLCDEKGTTAIELGLIGALISVVMIVVLTNIGTSLQAKFQEVATALK